MIAGIIVAIRRTSLDGERFYVIAGLLMTMGSMTIPKLITIIAAIIATAACATTGFLFTLLAGLNTHV